MAKTKTPFLSLGSHGTIGDAITSQKKGSLTLLREKPIPSYRRTLSQAYQRWLYEDYAYLWTQQSSATRQQYATKGTRHHLTGFQYWMKYHLTNLPDIAAMWHLDEKAGATAYDSSRNSNHGTIIGASPATGIINGCFYFDGLNDYLTIPETPSLRITSLLSLETFINTSVKTTVQFFLAKDDGTNRDYYLALLGTSGFPQFGIHKAGVTSPINGTTDLADGEWHHVAGVNDGTDLRIYIDGLLQATKFGGGGTFDDDSCIVSIGARGNLSLLFKGDIDHVIIHNRVLDITEIKRHSERRYPPQ